MKEYLNKTTYEYKLAHTKPDGEWVCIPEGAEVLSTDGDGNGLIFWKYDFNLVVGLDDHWDKIHQGFNDFFSMYPRCKVLWQRHTQPEELPFLDDKPSLNEQYAEIEKVRQSKIEETLAERQAQYGCFEDVAFVTESIMGVLSKVKGNGLQDLPHPHRMALYMIASKMARIVNGDFNSIDGWHDISGYARLVEKLIEGE